jgi:hypothetical protein
MQEPLISPERTPLFDKIVFAIFVVFVPSMLVSGRGIFNDGDTSWHVATGRWILANQTVPDSDPFSFTVAGQPWVPHEWLADVLLALAYDAGGHAALASIVMLSLLSTQLVVFLWVRRSVGPVGSFLALLGLSMALPPFILARPHVLVWPLLALWTATLLRSADEQRRPPLWLPLLMLAWANLHGSFLLGFVIMGCLALEAWVSAGWSWVVLKRWILVGAASLLASVVNANGVDALIHPVTITSMKTLHLIAEWQPSTTTKTPLFYVVLLATLALLLLRGQRIQPARLALLLVLLGMAFSQVRHQSWLAIVAALILPAQLRLNQQPLPKLFANSAVRVRWLAAASAAAALVVIGRLLVPLTPEQNQGFPSELLAAVPPELRSDPVLNGYSLGGPMILAGMRPYIDGRADLYGDAYFTEYSKVVAGDFPRFQRLVAKHGIAWTMLEFPDQGLIAALDASPEWRRIYADKVGVIHVRRLARRPSPQPAA